MSVRDLAWSTAGSSRIRVASFARRSRISLELVARIARAIGESASRLIAPEVRVDVFPPVALDDGGWSELCGGARTYLFRGASADAVVTIESADARRIAARAFGEDPAAAGPLSRLESLVIDRFVAEIATALAPVCGSTTSSIGASVPCTSYLEVRIGSPVEAALGIGIAREPEPVAGFQLSPSALDECEVECSARFGIATVDAGSLLGLRVGDLLRFDTKVGPSATLNVGANPVAAGEGGIVGDRNAFMICELTSGAELR